SMMAAVNPVELKIALATRGARLDPSARGLVGEVADFAPRGLQLVLPDDVRVVVPVGDDSSAAAPYAVLAEAGRAFVVADGAPDDHLRVEVQAAALPRFYSRRTSSGRPMWQVATVQGTHLLVNPTTLCGFSTLGAPCGFCREGARPIGELE